MAEVITNVKGTPIVSFEDQRDLGQEYLRNHVDVGLRKTNPDGSIARSRYHSAAVNMDWFYDNRFRMAGDRLQVVIAQPDEGWRAIKGIKNGNVGTKQVRAYEFVRDDKVLKFNQVVTVSDDEFVSDFTDKLDKESMKVILKILKKEFPSGGPSVPERKLPI